MREILIAIFIVANYLYLPWANAINDRQNRLQAPVWQGVVTFVSDGDTLMVRPALGGAPVKIRLDGLDAPEICQAHGMASRQALQSRVMGQSVNVQGRRRDNYGRVLARISRQRDTAGQAGSRDDVGEWMVRQGHAWSHRFRRDAGPYAAQEAEAKAAQRGLFEDARALQPRDFRKRHGPCDDRPRAGSRQPPLTATDR